MAVALGSCGRSSSVEVIAIDVVVLAVVVVVVVVASSGTRQ